MELWQTIGLKSIALVGLFTLGTIAKTVALTCLNRSPFAKKYFTTQYTSSFVIS